MVLGKLRSAGQSQKITQHNSPITSCFLCKSQNQWCWNNQDRKFRISEPAQCSLLMYSVEVSYYRAWDHLEQSRNEERSVKTKNSVHSSIPRTRTFQNESSLLSAKTYGQLVIGHGHWRATNVPGHSKAENQKTTKTHNVLHDIYLQQLINVSM